MIHLRTLDTPEKHLIFFRALDGSAVIAEKKAEVLEPDIVR